ncbi:hypothetical protein ACWD4J_34995 [Streptomyces sp. NPDC002577]
MNRPTSGFGAPSAVEPLLERSAKESSWPTAATVSAVAALPASQARRFPYVF